MALHPKSRAREAVRLAWLKLHPSVWADLPSDREDVTDTQSKAIRQLGDAMVAAGLYSPKTDRDRRAWGIRRLLRLLRGAK